MEIIDNSKKKKNLYTENTEICVSMDMHYVLIKITNNSISKNMNQVKLNNVSK